MTASNFSGDMAARPWAGSTTGPSAIYVSGPNKTYLGYIAETPPQTAKIMAYDHSAETWSPPYVIDTSLLSNDDHGVVALCPLSDGRMVAFYGSHATDQQWSISGVSSGAPVLTSWTRQTALTGGYSYPKPINIPDGSGGGTVYLFLRKTVSVNSRYVVRKATYTSGGALSFGAESALVDFDGGASARVYASAVRLNGANIEFCAVRSDSGDTTRQHVYYFRYIPSTGALENLDASVSTAGQVDLTTANASYRVVNSGSNESGWVDWCRDSGGNLHILYGDGTNGSSSFPLKHNVYSSGSWGTAATVGTVIDKEAGGGFVEVWALFQNGANVEAWYPTGGTWASRGGDTMARKVYSSGSWGSEQGILASGGTYALGHPQAVENANADCRVIFCEVSQGVDPAVDPFLAKRYAYGDSGFLTWPTLTDSSLYQDALLLNFDGANNATATTDGSTWANLHPITFSGNAKIDTTQSKFGGSSLRLDGTGDFLTIPPSRIASVGHEFFISGGTIELWFQRNDTGRLQTLMTTRPTGATAKGFFLGLDASDHLQLILWNNSGTSVLTIVGTTAIGTGAFHYAAIQRTAAATSIWLGGAQEASGTPSAAPVEGSNLIIGRDLTNTARDFNGWIDEIRWSKSVQRDVSVVPSAAFSRS